MSVENDKYYDLYYHQKRVRDRKERSRLLRSLEQVAAERALSAEGMRKLRAKRKANNIVTEIIKELVKD